MKINRRALLASGAALAGGSLLAEEAKKVGGASSESAAGIVTLTAMVKAKAGEEEAVKKILLSLVKPTRKEPGCLCYNLHQSKSDPTQFMFYEQWASKEALSAHGKTPHMKAFGPSLKGKTEKGGGVVHYQLLE